MRFSILLLTPLLVFQAKAVNLDEISFHNEQSDTTKITNILVKYVDVKDSGERILEIGKEFLGTPYVAHTLEGKTEMLTVNLDELDCTTFVETVMALSYTAGERRTSWRDYVYNLERIRYRNGKLDGYASRLHYISDWIIDNSYRGNFVEVTNRLPLHSYMVKNIDFMSAHRSSYPALADSVTFEKIKNTEVGYRNHRYPYIKSRDLYSKSVKESLRDGDVVALTCNLKDLDVSHMGIIVKKDGEPYLMHASSSNGKVEITKVPLCEFMKRNRNLTGIRVIRFEN